MRNPLSTSFLQKCVGLIVGLDKAKVLIARANHIRVMHNECGANTCSLMPQH